MTVIARSVSDEATQSPPVHRYDRHCEKAKPVPGLDPGQASSVKTEHVT
jgi:hypothetical protein